MANGMIERAHLTCLRRAAVRARAALLDIMNGVDTGVDCLEAIDLPLQKVAHELQVIQEHHGQVLKCNADR